MWTTSMGTMATTTPATWPPYASHTTARKRRGTMEDLEMSKDKPEDWAPPPPRKAKPDSLKRQAEAIVKLHQITFGSFKGKRTINCDVKLPKRDYDKLAEAMRQKLI